MLWSAISGRRRLRLIFILFLCLLLPRPAHGVEAVRVLLEDHPQIRFQKQLYEAERGADITITLYLEPGTRLVDCSYRSADISPEMKDVNGLREVTITLHRVMYPTLVRFETALEDVTRYHLSPEDGGFEIAETSGRLRLNSLKWDARFERDGMFALGWNSDPDGRGDTVGFGSRFDRNKDHIRDLYLTCIPCTAEESFVYEVRDGEAWITGFKDSIEESLVMPSKLGGIPAAGIARGAFGQVEVSLLCLPPTLRCIEPGAFESLDADTLVLFDGLTEISDASFGSVTVHSLRVNALRDPTYCGSWYDTFTEKADRLISLKDERKIILFCGSSARFGYESWTMESAFPEYQVVNMGVYAYANMLPQALIMLSCIREEDILLSSPELDAVEAQFCGSPMLDRETFCMVESDYDLISIPDLSAMTGIFDAFGAYQAVRADMEPLSYDVLPSNYYEDGAPSPTSTYNHWGDYIAPREDNTAGVLFGIKRADYDPDHITQADWDGLNRVYDTFRRKGGRVLFTFSPRSSMSVTEGSTAEKVAALDAIVRQKLHAQVLGTAEDSLMDAYWFYGTDNHLSTEGAERHTSQVIEWMKEALRE